MRSRDAADEVRNGTRRYQTGRPVVPRPAPRSVATLLGPGERTGARGRVLKNIIANAARNSVIPARPEAQHRHDPDCSMAHACAPLHFFEPSGVCLLGLREEARALWILCANQGPRCVNSDLQVLRLRLSTKK